MTSSLTPAAVATPLTHNQVFGSAAGELASAVIRLRFAPARAKSLFVNYTAPRTLPITSTA
jgi:hypothetical protein